MRWLPIVTLLLVCLSCESGKEPIGACCEGSNCTLVDEASCGGLFVAGLCTPNPCESIGACCLVGGECSLTPEVDCQERFIGPGTDCSMCPTDTACCDENDVCREVESPEDCDGRPIVGASCSRDLCDPPPPMPVACCNGTECSVLTPDACAAQGGIPSPGFDSCHGSACDMTGACCENDGSCTEGATLACDGVFVPNPTAGPDCLANTCNGACCDADNQCTIGSLSDCGDGDFIGPRSSCEPDPCENPVGACCEAEGCIERFRDQCDTLFFSNVSCEPDPCPAEVIELCAGVTQGEGASFLAWSFAVASSVDLAGEALLLGVEGPSGSFMADGPVTDDGRVRIEGVTVDAFGTYDYQVLSVGTAVVSGDVEGSIVVDGSDKPCLDGGGGSGGTGGSGGAGGQGSASPYAGCTEQPPGSVACECDPFADNCSGSLNCSINFFVDFQTSVIESVPALDGSDCCPASECISDVIQTVGLGGACNIVLAGTLRRDDCLPGLFCDPDSEEICVPLCVDDEDCADNSCELFALTNPGFGPLGRCGVP